MSILNVHQYEPLNASQNKVFIPFLLNMTTSFLAILSDILLALNNCKKNFNHLLNDLFISLT